MGDLEQLAAAVMNGDPRVSDVDHWRGCVSTANRIAAAAGITPPATGVAGAGGPFRAPTDPRGILVEQLGTRWPCSDGRARALPEMVSHVLGVVSALPAKGGTTPPSPPSSGGSTPTTGPSGGTSSAWRALPTAGKSAITSWTDSWQSATPTFEADGIHVRLPATGGRPAAGASAAAGGTQRCECYVAGADKLSGRRFFRLDVDLRPGFPADADDWQLICQWKNDGPGSPPLSLEVRDGGFYLQWHNAAGDPVDDRRLGDATDGAHGLVVDVTFSTSRDSAPVSAWLDGTKVCDAAKVAPTLYPGRSDYWKVGLYRSSSIARPAEVVVRGLAHGADFLAVT